MYAFDKSTGASQWSNDVLKNRGLGSPAFLNNNILVVDDTGYINLFSRNDGQLIARVSSNLSGGTSYPWSNGHRVIMQSGSGNISSITQ
jgi:outer membrane protein assembly factor BamB